MFMEFGGNLPHAHGGLVPYPRVRGECCQAGELRCPLIAVLNSIGAASAEALLREFRVVQCARGKVTCRDGHTALEEIAHGMFLDVEHPWRVVVPHAHQAIPDEQRFWEEREVGP